MTGAVIDIRTRAVVAPPFAPRPSDEEVARTICREIIPIMEKHLPEFSAASTDKPHLERALRSMRRQTAARRS